MIDTSLEAVFLSSFSNFSSCTSRKFCDRNKRSHTLFHLVTLTVVDYLLPTAQEASMSLMYTMASSFVFRNLCSILTANTSFQYFTFLVPIPFLLWKIKNSVDCLLILSTSNSYAFRQCKCTLCRISQVKFSWNQFWQ